MHSVDRYPAHKGNSGKMTHVNCQFTAKNFCCCGSTTLHAEISGREAAQGKSKTETEGGEEKGAVKHLLSLNKGNVWTPKPLLVSQVFYKEGLIRVTSQKTIGSGENSGIFDSPKAKRRQSPL